MSTEEKITSARAMLAEAERFASEGLHDDARKVAGLGCVLVEGISGAEPARLREQLSALFHRSHAWKKPITPPAEPEPVEQAALVACRKCGALKALTEFGVEPRNRTGRDSTCKSCRAKRQRECYLGRKVAGAKGEPAKPEVEEEYVEANPILPVATLVQPEPEAEPVAPPSCLIGAAQILPVAPPIQPEHLRWLVAAAQTEIDGWSGHNPLTRLTRDQVQCAISWAKTLLLPPEEA